VASAVRPAAFAPIAHRLGGACSADLREARDGGPAGRDSAVELPVGMDLTRELAAAIVVMAPH
jgi:hypothetical protein